MPSSPTDLRAVIAKSGAWAVVACFLIYKLAGQFYVKLEAIDSKVDHHIAEQVLTRMLLFRICVNTADDENERILCQQVLATPAPLQVSP